MSPTPTEDDPLLSVTMPPPDETSQQRVARETIETQAKALSEEIDRQLYKDRDAFTNKETIRILLLGRLVRATSRTVYLLQLPSTGQSESGKSTTLKSKSMSSLSWLSARHYSTR